MAIGNTHKQLVNFSRAVFKLCKQTDRQTDRQTNNQYSSKYFASLPGAK